MRAWRWDGQGGISQDSAPLLELVSVEQVAPDCFTGWCRASSRPRAFGGQLIAQALVAAGRSDPDARPVHSLHANFLEGGDVARPVEYRVDTVRAGRSFSSRIVRAWQDDRLLLHLFASFHVDEAGREHAALGPEVPGPETLPEGDGSPLDVRAVKWLPDTLDEDPLAEQLLWVRGRDQLPDDPLIHCAAVAFQSDLALGWASWKAHGVHVIHPEMFSTTLDHSIWFHRPVRADDWLLFHQQSRASAGGRGFNSAEIYPPDRRLAVTVAAESVMRGPVRPGPAG